MKRHTRARIAEETVAIVQAGEYESPSGRTVDISAQVNACLERTTFYAPNQLARIRNEVVATSVANPAGTIELRNETTLQGIARLSAESGGPIAALNFASARNPGGGFLGGAHAQEESLARSSALYASLLRAPQYYDQHRGMKSCLYSDAMILSPDCPVIRDDDGDLLEQPLTATFVTSPAPNAGAIAKNDPRELPLIPDVFRRRIEYVLALAAWHGYGTIILGAWGCGAFRNDPEMVAGVLGELLGNGSTWWRRFRRIVFSVLDTSSEQAIFTAFSRVLSS